MTSSYSSYQHDRLPLLKKNSNGGNVWRCWEKSEIFDLLWNQKLDKNNISFKEPMQVWLRTNISAKKYLHCMPFSFIIIFILLYSHYMIKVLQKLDEKILSQNILSPDFTSSSRWCNDKHWHFVTLKITFFNFLLFFLQEH